MVNREYYLKQLRLLKDQKLIKVITGIRRSGKSTLLANFRDELAASGIKKSQIQSFNFEEEQNVDLRDWRKLHNLVESRLVPDKMNYLFFDEIQKVEHFEEAIDSLFVKENVDIYITGSNAFLLSGELATLLTGRYITIHVLPFSFQEYRLAFSEEENEYRLFTQYLNSSAFPEATTIAKIDHKLSQNYLSDLYDTIINKDICERYEIRNLADFTNVIKYVFSMIGSVISARNIENALKNSGSTIAHNTIVKYLDYLVQSYLIYPVSRYDIKGKKLLTTNDKYFVVDLGLRDLLLSPSAESDIGHRLENVVYFELLKRGEGQIMIGKTEDLEVDFVVQKPGGERIYYQVSYHTDSSETLAREIAPFSKIHDNYPKVLLTLDLVPEEINGIRKINLIDWLLENE